MLSTKDYIFRYPIEMWPRRFGRLGIEQLPPKALETLATDMAIDLTLAPFIDRTEVWTHLTQYEKCQELADLCRDAGIDLILTHPRAIRSTN